MTEKSSYAGKVYPYYYVTCGVCGEEWTLGTTNRDQIAYYLERGGYKRTKKHGYVCEGCSKKTEAKA
jgi:hypothetical protein